MTVCDLSNGGPLHANAIRESDNTLFGVGEMFEKRHSPNVPIPGTMSNGKLCPTGHLSDWALDGHNGAMLANRIAHYRKAGRLTQDELAAAIGTTRNMLVKLEKGTRPLSSDWLEKIGAALEVAPYLLIAPERTLPSEAELAEMLGSAQDSLPAGLPYSEWPRAIAAGLHMRLRLLAGDRANVGTHLR